MGRKHVRVPPSTSPSERGEPFVRQREHGKQHHHAEDGDIEDPRDVRQGESLGDCRVRQQFHSPFQSLHASRFFWRHYHPLGFSDGKIWCGDISSIAGFIRGIFDGLMGMLKGEGRKLDLREGEPRMDTDAHGFEA